MVNLCIIILIIAQVLLQVDAVIKVNTNTHGFTDENGRELFFHGVNAVYKIAPWVPLTTGFDSNNSLSDIDAKNLKNWGFNIVRLGVMWPGVEPTQGSYNITYLSEIETIVKNLNNEGIYVLLDFHQDLFHRKFCGEGVPDYVYDICYQAEPNPTKSFPAPVVNTTYPIDSDNNPTLESCLTRNFFDYYMTQEVSWGFQCLYNNVNNLWDNFANYWKTIAKTFQNYDNVLGYEIINEPWLGDLFHTHKTLVPDYTEKTYLQPMYEYIHQAIRSIDDSRMIFYEGLTVDYWPNGFTQGPGGPQYNDRQVLSYHIYCPISNATMKKEFACQAIDDEFYLMRQHDINRLGGGMMMTEFGATPDVPGNIYALQKLCEQSDKHSQSWIYWQFKYYQDITTCTPVGESLYNDDGTVNDDKLRVLTRSYPHAVAGTNIKYQFYEESGKFELSYDLLSSVASVDAGTTVVYFNKEYHYPLGAKVNVVTSPASSSGSIEVSCGGIDDPGFIYVKQISEVSTTTSMSVTVTPCKATDLSSCTCKL